MEILGKYSNYALCRIGSISLIFKNKILAFFPVEAEMLLFSKYEPTGTPRGAGGTLLCIEIVCVERSWISEHVQTEHERGLILIWYE